ncbi:MAG: PadR family transcriptional regulator [Candidatus Lokiarchaeota archaeon]|nr:PadR family transcriptional regulator [Candidatus Lokiarchaeota archaeon]
MSDNDKKIIKGRTLKELNEKYGEAWKDDQYKPKAINRLIDKITKANLWLYILRLLIEKPRYGYEIKNKIKDRYGFSPAIVSSYVILYKMKKDKLVEEHEEINKEGDNNKSGKPGRIYYYITDLGKETMSEAKEYIVALLDEIFDLC